MRVENRELLVVGDRVLLRPDKPEERTEVGLYLPQTAVEREKVQSGHVVSVGPGQPLPDLMADEDEPWRPVDRKARYLPMQAEVGDYALFLKKAAIEIKFDGQEYLVVPQSGILVLIRSEDHV